MNKPNCPDFILAETSDGLVLSYRGDEFTIDDEMRKDLRKYLMMDVIKELESRYRHYVETGFSVRANELHDVISLIRGDGE